MLFILNDSGVPSVARWLRLNATGGLDDPDAFRPAPVTDLSITAGKTSAAITWTSPGDDSLCGTPQEFDLRWSTSPINTSNFSSATRLTTSSPGPAGTVHCVDLTGLSSCTWYYAAIKT